MTLAYGLGRACRITPAASGFSAGAKVDCDGFVQITVKVDDDPARGLVTARIGDVQEAWHYDPDSGRLLP